MNLTIGDNLVDGRLVVVTVAEDKTTVVAIPSLDDRSTGQKFTIGFAPGITLAFIGVQVDAALHGQVPPFVGI